MLFLCLKYQGFKVRRRLKCNYGCLWIGFIHFKRELDALSFKGCGVGLDLHVLVQQAVYGFLCFVNLRIKAGIGMQLELLLNGLCQIPAKKHERLLAMAFGVQEAPGFVIGCVQISSSRFLGDSTFDGFAIVGINIDFTRNLVAGCAQGEQRALCRYLDLVGA